MSSLASHETVEAHRVQSAHPVPLSRPSHVLECEKISPKELAITTAPPWRCQTPNRFSPERSGKSCPAPSHSFSGPRAKDFSMSKKNGQKDGTAAGLFSVTHCDATKM